MICFGAIWTALAIFSIDGWRAAAKARAAPVL
jgi:EamA domain-containing membrane protein RarD